MAAKAPTQWLGAIKRSIQSNRAVGFSRFMQLATVSCDGFPHCRTVVFRGWWTDVTADADPHSLVIFTDMRSQKIQDLAHQSVVEVCWYFSLTHEQYRIRGQVDVLKDDGDQVRTAYWGQQTEDTRKMYHAATPGQPCDPHTGAQGNGDLDQYDPQKTDPNVPSEHFAVLILRPTFVDHVTYPRPVDPVKPVHRGSPHESLLGKSKSATRYQHTKVHPEQDHSDWTVTRVNP